MRATSGVIPPLTLQLGNGSVREKWVSQSSAEQVRPVDEPIPTVAPQPGSPVPPDSPTPSLALTLAKTPAVGAECQVYAEITISDTRTTVCPQQNNLFNKILALTLQNVGANLS